MSEIIEKIRQKPDHQKARIIWIILSIVTALLLITWLIISSVTKEPEIETNIIDDITTDYQENQNQLPDLFNNQSN